MIYYLCLKVPQGYIFRLFDREEWGKMEKERERRKEAKGKKEERRQEKKGIVVKKRENVLILFYCLIYIGHYDRQKSLQKNLSS